MAKSEDIVRLVNAESAQESGLRSHWYDVLKHIKKDLAYIWDKDVKRDFEAMRGELNQIKHILTQLSSYYKTNRKAFRKELKEVNSLLSYLEEVKASKKWVRGTHAGLQRIIDYIEKDKISLRQYRGDLHVHSSEKVDNIPVSGSNPGALTVAEMVKYFRTRMGQKFVAFTDYSRDANPKAAMDYWVHERPDIAKEVVDYDDKRIEAVYKSIDKIQRPGLEVFKGIEVNLLWDGRFDTNLPASPEVRCVNCSIHPNINRVRFAKIRRSPGLYTNLAILGIQNPLTNIICHLGFSCNEGVVENLDWDRICTAAINYKVAIENNLHPLVKLIFDKIMDFEKYPADDPGYKKDLIKEIKDNPSTYLRLLGSPVIRKKMKKYFRQGLKLAINTDLKWNPFIGDGKLRKQGRFRRFRDVKNNQNFRIKRIRFLVCLKIVEKELQKAFKSAGINLDNIINSYPPNKLALFLKKKL